MTKISLETVAGKPALQIKSREKVRTYEAFCPHRGGPLHEGHSNGNCLTCPWHGSQFDIETGALLKGPSTKPLKTLG